MKKENWNDIKKSILNSQKVGLGIKFFSKKKFLKFFKGFLKHLAIINEDDYIHINISKDIFHDWEFYNIKITVDKK